jgi:hypothetical protein
MLVPVFAIGRAHTVLHRLAGVRAAAAPVQGDTPTVAGDGRADR